ncbi:hypothetical protein [Streptomyces sp. NPDC005548]|uniref:hypothetical protein n=1 Tax=Streptomyces sp. NPDC005548 TaxID=3364724 RepID=UPI0036BC74FC
MDINALFTEDGMRNFTAEQRDTFMNDGQQIRQMQRIVQARLAQITVEGDRPGAPGRRARKMARKFGKVATMLEKAAAQFEAINASYIHDVIELPERRVKQLESKANRRQRLGIAASGVEAAAVNSLTRSAAAFNGTVPANPQAAGVQPAPQYVNPQPFHFPAPAGADQQLPNIGDFFDQRAAQ